ncbi:DNA-binding MarR family transcriptional regulator [Labedaea rhizosphaerae]|uniref:DNA-binding MarR family transcriptional regulator n=2 Tax=Labedaea rhizosphaerae TaxID=598644 RepID=A0A4R6SJA6_LABRH|nr:DNA-binding MarR family transcriptional regulator [Labedaea rhizosphaerae]
MNCDYAGRMSDSLYPWLHIQQGVVAVQDAMNAMIEAEAGCTLIEHSALYRLKQFGDLRMGELAELLAISPSGVTRLIDRLARRGWVTRVQPEASRREVLARLTPEGLAALNTRTRPAYHRAVEESFSGLLTERDLADLRRIGHKLLAGHDRWDAKRFAT